MKTINNTILVAAMILLGAVSCSDPELPTPNTFSTGATYKAFFSFANATVDAPSLDFYVNGINLGTAARGNGSGLASAVQIPMPGNTGGVTASTSIRAKATTAGTTIGGLLDLVTGAPENKNLIFRSTSNGTANFAAVNGGSYTFIAVDSINRPIPVRLNRQTATIAFADVTYWNPNTKSMISASRRDSLNPANCKFTGCTPLPLPSTVCTGCDNWDAVNQVQTTSTATEFANLVTMGLVPLGLTDPGGVRFLVLNDAPLTFTTVTQFTDAGIRFVNAVANSNGITAAPNGNGTVGGPPMHARLRETPPGVDFTLAAGTASVVSVAGGFNPTAGSRTFGALAFTPPRVIAAAGTSKTYILEVSSDAGFATILYTSPNTVSFAPGKNYTVFIRGIVGGTGSKAISHGIITH